MFTSLIRKIFGSHNERCIKKLHKIVLKINDYEQKFIGLQDHELPLQTQALRKQIQQGKNIDDVLVEAFALVRETAKRTVGMRPFDVQLMGGISLHNGYIAEMRTGEGKTLVATLPAYLNALSGKGVHVITVNDYLAQRDAEWMRPIYTALGLTTGVVFSAMDTEERKKAYAADITYGTNNEFGFDYLRDNLAFSLQDHVQKELNYAIVDEVDSVLIDEARTPLVISGIIDDTTDIYSELDKLIPKLTRQMTDDGPGHFSIDEKSKQAYLTEEGNQYIEQLLREKNIIDAKQHLYDPANIGVLHHLNAAIRAHTLFHKDVDYIVKDKQIVIVDEFTGRTMQGRRWSDGLHQAIEAKERVKIQNENQTLASITYQNYFRLYKKLSGMTGTADTEAFEFRDIYNLEVIVIPTHMQMIRHDAGDRVHIKAKQKFTAIIEDIKDCQQRDQPILVGTASIEVSEFLSKRLSKEKIKHQVLNAKHHNKEAKIIGQAGMPGAVTIATNMAGRGTDIVLGGNIEMELEQLDPKNEEKAKQLRDTWHSRHQKTIAAGGLRIIGTERHESRRIDNQLRGRSGRQGDPGSSQFYLSLEDDLMRIFASDKVSMIMERLGIDSDEVIESSLVSRAIENAQRKIEAHNFDIRKHLLEYDDVANDQRKVIYTQRNTLLLDDDIKENVDAMREEVVNNIFYNHIPPNSTNELWDLDGLTEVMENDFGVNLKNEHWIHTSYEINEESLRQKILAKIQSKAQEKEDIVGAEVMRKLETHIMLNILDRRWKEHLVNMDQLRQGISLRSYAAKNPKQEYKREAFDIFVSMLENTKHDVIYFLAKVHLTDTQDTTIKKQDNYLPPKQEKQTLTFNKDKTKIGRNELCPCGSGQKYKKCHGQNI